MSISPTKSRFLATYESIAKQLVRDLDDDEIANVSPRAVLERVLAGAAAHPDAAQIVLIQALAGPAAVRTQHERLLSSFEARIERYLEAYRGGRLEIPARFPGRDLWGRCHPCLPQRSRWSGGSAGDDLMAWVDSHATSGEWRPLGTAGWMELSVGFSGAEPDSLGEKVLERRLPRGRPRRPRARSPANGGADPRRGRRLCRERGTPR